MALAITVKVHDTLPWLKVQTSHCHRFSTTTTVTTTKALFSRQHHRRSTKLYRKLASRSSNSEQTLSVRSSDQQVALKVSGSVSMPFLSLTPDPPINSKDAQPEQSQEPEQTTNTHSNTAVEDEKDETEKETPVLKRLDDLLKLGAEFLRLTV
jgi:glutamate-1-semialdehyde aminotransferase